MVKVESSPRVSRNIEILDMNRHTGAQARLEPAKGGDGDDAVLDAARVALALARRGLTTTITVEPVGGRIVASVEVVAAVGTAT